MRVDDVDDDVDGVRDNAQDDDDDDNDDDDDDVVQCGMRRCAPIEKLVYGDGGGGGGIEGGGAWGTTARVEGRCHGRMSVVISVLPRREGDPTRRTETTIVAGGDAARHAMVFRRDNGLRTNGTHPSSALLDRGGGGGGMMMARAVLRRRSCLVGRNGGVHRDKACSPDPIQRPPYTSSSSVGLHDHRLVGPPGFEDHRARFELGDSTMGGTAIGTRPEDDTIVLAASFSCTPSMGRRGGGGGGNMPRRARRTTVDGMLFLPRPI